MTWDGIFLLRSGEGRGPDAMPSDPELTLAHALRRLAETDDAPRDIASSNQGSGCAIPANCQGSPAVFLVCYHVLLPVFAPSRLLITDFTASRLERLVVRWLKRLLTNSGGFKPGLTHSKESEEWKTPL
jgi:hypothetical protein